MTIATTGHVDHGKTILLRATVGVNADRLPEEERRGMTIDFGYVYWPRPDGRMPGFIDMSGHEKFLSNVLAGVGGVDHMLLVVVCDDGVTAQTREHLTILQLTDNPMLTVALIKADRVDEVRADEVERQIKKVLREYGFAEAELLITITTEGRRIDALRKHLLQLPEREHASQHSFRLAVNHVFIVEGTGLVVTDTALSREVKVSDSLWLTGVNKLMRIRALCAQNQPTETVHAGQRITLNIMGDAEEEQINCGDWLLADVPPEPFARMIAELQIHMPLAQWQPLHIHHATSHITGRVSLLEDNLVELVFDTSLWLADSDYIMPRNISTHNTLAEARMVMFNPPRRGERKPEYLQWLAPLVRVQNDANALSVHPEHGAVSLANFVWMRQFNGERIYGLLQQSGCTQVGCSLLNAPVVACWQRKILDALTTHHEQHRNKPGPGREHLRRMALSMGDEALVLLLAEKVRESGDIHNRHSQLHLPDHKVGFSVRQWVIWQKAEPLLGDEPRWMRDLTKEMGTDEQTMRLTLRQAVQQGITTAVAKDRYYHNDRIVEFANMTRGLDQECGSTCAVDFRDRLGVDRKLAVQILEYFDRIGSTRRRGNDHLLYDALLFPEK